MKNNLTDKISELLIYGYFVLFLLQSTIPFFADSSEGFFAIIDSALIISIFALNYRKLSYGIKTKLLLLVTLIFALISIPLTGGGFGSFLNLARFLMGIMVFSSIEPGKKGQKRLGTICLIIWLYYLALSPTAWSLYRSGQDLYNPNTVGGGLFFASTVLLHFVKKGYIKIAIVVLSIAGILLAQCRSALLAECVYLILLYVPLMKKIIEKVKFLLPCLIVAIGSIFPVIYTKLYTTNTNVSLLYIEKDLFTGREVIWGRMLDALNSNTDGYLLGLGSKNIVSNGEMISNYHTWYFGVLYTFGIPIMLIYFLLFIRSLQKITVYDVFCGMLGIMVLGFFETAALFSFVQAYIFIYFLLGRLVPEKGREK